MIIKRKPTIAVIMNAYRRNYFDEQFRVLENQSIKPTEYYLYQNTPQHDLRGFCKKNKIVHIYSDNDFGCFGRFTIPLLVKTEFCLVIDDDVIPGPRWIENCLRCHEKFNGAVGSMGQRLPYKCIKEKNFIFKEGRYCIRKQEKQGYYEIKGLSRDYRVDYILHNYFFRREWIKYFWSLNPLYCDMFEDFHFGITLTRAGVPLYVAKQENLDESGCTKWAHQYDGQESMDRSMRRPHAIREFFDYSWSNGWRPLCVKKRALKFLPFKRLC